MVLIVAAALVFLLLGFQFRSLTSAAADLSGAADFAGQRPVRPVDHAHAAERFVVHGGDPADRPGREERHHPDRIHRPTSRADGLPLHEALLQAGRTRFRPILMTSLTAIFGLMPLALGIGPGAQMQQPLAIAVIGGLIANMLLTRLLIPIGYQVLKVRDAQPSLG